MPNFRIPLFGKTRAVEVAIDEFLDAVSEAGILFGKTVEEYVTHGINEDCMRHQRRVSEIERGCDDLRRGIETVLLTQMLIPESRSDVLRLINLLDGLLDRIKRELLSMTIEAPHLPKSLHDDLRRLVSAICSAIEATVLASRAFFVDQRAVRDHVHKIGLYESEADSLSIRMKTRIFADDRDLAEKMMLRDFIDSLDRLADQAEDVGDQLSVFSLRRSL
ncbi:MAG: putative phosphate transport protein (TIGR00153 family) [Candidatus Paceibacteria bacterium]|jgi:predicted phosphate transport protein (TIGR00153 family)